MQALTNDAASPVTSVLFVDDNHDDFELIENQLELYKESGIVMEYSACLAAAFTRLRQGGIDLILLDLSLPDSQGVETVKAMRLYAPTIPLVVLTGTAADDIALESLKYGAEDYLVKGSFDAGSLCRSINYALTRNSAREAYERLATIVEASSDAIIGKTLNGTVTSWNTGAAKLFGYSKEEMIGKSIEMIMPPESSTELAEILTAINRGECIKNRETIRVKKGGERLDVSSTISPIVRYDGTISGAAAVDRDITERKQADKVLKESEERYRLLVTGAKDYAIFMLDPNGLVASWNDGAKRMKGYEAGEIIGKHFSVFYTIADQQLGLPDSHLTTALEQGSFEGIGWCLRKDGSYFFADVVITALFNSDNSLRGFTKVTRDISERKLAEKEVGDATLRLGLALDAAAVGVWDFDLVNNSVWRSLRHDEIFGYRESLPEWNFDIFATHVLPEDLELAKIAFQSGLEQGQFRMECRIIRVDDKAIRWLSARGETFCNDDGVPIRMMGTVADITDIKEQQEQQRLLAIMKEREDFMATLTHDMKNPLIGASRLLEMFVDGNLGELTTQQCEMLKCLKESNAGLLKLIADLIDVYRLEKDVNLLLFDDNDLVPLIATRVSQTIPFAKLRSITVRAQLPENLPVRIDGNSLERVVQNLLDNALKFAPNDGSGSVSVRLFTVDNKAVIEIEDNGPGIASEEQSGLFKRFSQASAGKRHSGGSGLGLYLCKQIVEAHGGTIQCKSDPNSSTIFSVTLPLTTNIEEIVVSS